MADLNIDNQINKTSVFKQDILKRIEETNAIFEKRDNDLLAAVLYRYYDRDNYDGNTITDDDFIGNKKAYINFLASDKEDVQKAIAENERILKDKQNAIKSSIIDFFKFKAELYVTNQNILSELEAELKTRKKQSCKLNEAIASGEQEINILKQDLDAKEAKYKEKEQEMLEIESKISLIDQKLLNDNLSDEELEKLNSEMFELTAKKATLDPLLTDLNLEVVYAQDKYTVAKNDLEFNKMDLIGLNISDYEAKLKTAKEGNEKLKESIEQDRADFAAVGFDISEKDIIDSQEPKVSNNTTNTTNTTDSKTNNQQAQQKNTTQQVANNVQTQQTSNLPAPQTPAQRANTLKNQILGCSDEDTKALLANNGYSDILSSIGNYNNKDKKMLMDKIGNLNSPLDVNKLSNIVSAIERSGLCSRLNLQNLIYSNGKLKDFSQLSNDDIDSLNKFVTEIETNKDSIDDNQLDFLQNNFINNIRCNSLKQALQPKKLKDFFKSKTAREQDKIRDAKLNNLCSSISSIPPNKQDTPAKSSDFFNALTGNTRDNIEPPTNTKTQPNKDVQTR